MTLDKYINKVICGDCLTALQDMPDNSVDSIVTDPPYGLSFMGKKWDYDVPSVDIWQQCLRVLKPGGHLLSFAGTRTQHRMACNIEDAGFEIRDMIAWVYGSGFPKSLDIGKAVDKELGNERESIGIVDSKTGNNKQTNWKCSSPRFYEGSRGNSEWEGWGTALKPALEPITVARKPLSEKTVAQNVLKHGTGGINIDESRIDSGERPHIQRRNDKALDGAIYGSGINGSKSLGTYSKGRFPSNFIHDGSDEVVSLFPETSSGEWKGQLTGYGNEWTAMASKKARPFFYEANNGSAARFFATCKYDSEDFAQRFVYTAKASRSERNDLLDDFSEKEKKTLNEYIRPSEGRTASKSGSPMKNHHPTVKPLSLMKYLVKLITPPNGIVLDPFAGTCTTLLAGKELGFRFIGIEIDKEYVKIGEARLRQEMLNFATS